MVPWAKFSKLLDLLKKSRCHHNSTNEVERDCFPKKTPLGKQSLAKCDAWPRKGGLCMGKIVGKDGFIWLTLGIFLCISSTELNLGSFHIPGAGFLPFLSGASLALLGLILILTSTLAGSREGNKVKNHANSIKWNFRDLLIPFLALLVLFLYFLLLERWAFYLQLSFVY